MQEKTRRQELYQQFIEEASKLYVDALNYYLFTAIPFLIFVAQTDTTSSRASLVTSVPGITLVTSFPFLRFEFHD
ncbi:MAG: hypothetical protein JO232_05825 [Verrucomicrobia bacterium]|nr:hypothetical protein [Verrucomicrobiota bacterium]